MFFEDRKDAGKILAQSMKSSGQDLSGFTILGIARGGVIIGQELAEELHLPLQAICVDEVQIPDKGLLTLTSLGTGLLFRNKLETRFVPNLDELAGEQLAVDLQKDIAARTQLYNGGQPFGFNGKVMLVDDGIVSGRTIFAAMASLQDGTRDIRVAIPVALPWVQKRLGDKLLTWRVSTLEDAPTGMFYFQFGDTTDEEVVQAVAQAMPNPV